MRSGPAEIHQQAIAQILRNVSLVALDDLATGTLVQLHQVAQLLRVARLRKRGGPGQITEDDGELAPLGFRAERFSRRTLILGRTDPCRRRFGLVQLGDSFQEPLAVAKGVHAELLEIRIREIGQQIQIDRVALEMLSVLGASKPLQPLPDGLHLGEVPCGAARCQQDNY
jgi:hypothetical protein